MITPNAYISDLEQRGVYLKFVARLASANVAIPGDSALVGMLLASHLGRAAVCMKMGLAFQLAKLTLTLHLAILYILGDVIHGEADLKARFRTRERAQFDTFN